MNALYNEYWWLFLVRGILAILLGLLALLMPITAFAGLVIYIGAYMLVDGLFSAIAAVSQRKTYSNWGWLLVFGLLGIAAGILTFINPFVTGTALIYLVAFWAMVIGIAEIVWAIRLRKVIRGEGWYILAGIFSIVFGLLVLFYPMAGAITLAIMFGVYALVIGTLLVSLSFRLRRQHSRIIPIA